MGVELVAVPGAIDVRPGVQAPGLWRRLTSSVGRELVGELSNKGEEVSGFVAAPLGQVP